MAEEPKPPQGRRGAGRFTDWDHLITLLDELDDERTRARFREAVYIAVIVWMLFTAAAYFLPRFFPHAPVVVVAPQEHHPNLTYLETPPDIRKLTRPPRPTPNISERSTEAQSPRPAPQPPQARAGAPAAAPQPARPQPQAPPQQQPAPQQPAPQQPQQPQPQRPPTPSRNSAPLVDAPAPTQSANNRPTFGQQQSPGQSIRDAARGANRAEGGDYGNASANQNGAEKLGTQILSDTQGVDFSKYLARLLADIKRNWLPLIPEECRPPLNKQGVTLIRFKILPDGTIVGRTIDDSTHDVAIDRAAWGSIGAVGKAQPLPPAFHGPELELRIEFLVNKEPAAR